MKFVLVAVTAFGLSFGASAKITNVEFKALDQTAETMLCVAAAKGGLPAAKSAAETLGIKFSDAKRKTICNDTVLSRFASRYSEQKMEVAKPSAFKFVVADNQAASKICREAAVNGLLAAQKIYKNIDGIYCNGKSIEQFVRQIAI